MLEDLQGDLRRFLLNNFVSRFTSDLGNFLMNNRIFHQGGHNILQSILVVEILLIVLKIIFSNFKY